MEFSRQPYISKSTYLMGLQCQKLIWFRYNAKDQIPAPDEATQAIFDRGAEVGELARQLNPGGIVVAPGSSSRTKSSPKPKRRSRPPPFV